jgi:hypothetical protein
MTTEGGLLQTQSWNEQVANLRWYNLFMGCIHAGQAALVLALSTGFRLSLTSSFLSYNPLREEASPLLSELVSVPLGPLVAAFFLLSAVAHLVVTVPGVFAWYARNLRRHINYLRWFEYALSSSLMLVIIAMLSSMFDLPSLVLLFALNACMNLFGLMMELHNQATGRTNWTAFYCGIFAGVVPWLIIAWYFFAALSSFSGSIPTFVWFILPTVFLLFNAFAVNMVLQYKKVGPWRDYLYGEKMYILLSLVAKSALAWQVFSGTLR